MNRSRRLVSIFYWEFSVTASKRANRRFLGQVGEKPSSFNWFLSLLASLRRWRNFSKVMSFSGAPLPVALVCW